jgi:beta-glucosidase
VPALDILLQLPVVRQTLSLTREHTDETNDTIADSTTAWDSAVGKANAILAELTLEEKAGIITGANPLDGLGCIGSIGPVPRLNFSGICYSDGSSGVNRADLTSVFPAGLTAAATWDADLIYRRAVAIGEEFRAKGMRACLGWVLFHLVNDSFVY